jgi:hypothetical protein
LRVIRPAYLILLVAGGLALAPFALPILPVETFIRYAAFLGVAPSTTETKKLGDNYGRAAAIDYFE